MKLKASFFPEIEGEMARECAVGHMLIMMIF